MHHLAADESTGLAESQVKLTNSKWCDGKTARYEGVSIVITWFLVSATLSRINSLNGSYVLRAAALQLCSISTS